MTVMLRRGGTGAEQAAPARAQGGRRRRLETTAEKLRLLQLLLMVVCVVCGLVAAAAVQARIGAANEIEERTEPLSADAVDVYRALADADATIASEFLPGAEASPRYQDGIAAAAAGLARAGTLTSRDSLTADRIADIAVALPAYTGLVERARAKVDAADRVATLKEASMLMQSTILRRAEAFQRTESQRLDTQYRRAGALPTVAVAAGATSLLALVAAQVMLTRRTRRLLNLGLFGAGAIVAGLALWWALALSASDDHLADSRRHSQSVSDALGQAQIAARQARASEILALVANEPRGSYKDDYSARMLRLARADGAGGALGAARRFISDPAGQEAVTATVADTRAWLAAHARIQELHEGGRYREAIALAVGANAPSETAFTAIDLRLAGAVATERDAFGTDVDQAEEALAGLVPGTIALMLVAAGAAAWGIGQRLKEYR